MNLESSRSETTPSAPLSVGQSNGNLRAIAATEQGSHSRNLVTDQQQKLKMIPISDPPFEL
jgi:hypothetical protein